MQPTVATHGGARFVGDAEIGGMPLSRILNALCYIVTGVALLVATGSSSTPAWMTVLLGLAGLGYGLKILATRSSYWVSSVVYLFPVIAIFWAIGSITG